MTLPLILYSNVLATGVVTASSEAAGFPAARALDGLTYTAWKPDEDGAQWIAAEHAGAVAANTLGLANHNLATRAAVVKVQTSPDGSAWTDRLTVTPASDLPLMRSFASVAALHWRLLVTFSGPAPFISAVMVGPGVVVERGLIDGYKPISLNDEGDEVTTHITESGHYVGRSLISRGAAWTLALRNLSRAWVEDEWAAFARHAKTRPFFFAEDEDDLTENVGLFWSDAARIPVPELNGSMLYYDTALSLRGMADHAP